MLKRVRRTIRERELLQSCPEMLEADRELLIGWVKIHTELSSCSKQFKDLLSFKCKEEPSSKLRYIHILSRDRHEHTCKVDKRLQANDKQKGNSFIAAIS